jgi:hypothetical protein
MTIIIILTIMVCSCNVRGVYQAELELATQMLEQEKGVKIASMAAPGFTVSSDRTDQQKSEADPAHPSAAEAAAMRAEAELLEMLEKEDAAALKAHIKPRGVTRGGNAASAAVKPKV